MMTTSGSSRIVKRKLADGDISYTFSVCRHIRILGKPNHIQLAKIGTFRESEFGSKAAEFWEIVDAELTKLVKQNKLWSNDRQKVERAFEKHILRPTLSVAKTVEPSPESNSEILQTLIADLAEKAERQLAERGY